MSKDRKLFTIKELFTFGFKTEDDGNVNYLSKQTDHGLLVTQDFNDITVEPTNKAMVKVWRLKDSIKESWDTAITEEELLNLIIPVV